MKDNNACKTADDVLAKYTEAEKITPAYERVTIFSWRDLCLLREEILLCRAEKEKSDDEILNIETKSEIKQALNIAADALEIASDWYLSDIQVNPPRAWGLCAENKPSEQRAIDGWCNTRALANKLRELAAEK